MSPLRSWSTSRTTAFTSGCRKVFSWPSDARCCDGHREVILTLPRTTRWVLALLVAPHLLFAADAEPAPVSPSAAEPGIPRLLLAAALAPGPPPAAPPPPALPPVHANLSAKGPATGLADSAALRATVFGTPPQDIAPMPEKVPLQEINISMPWARPVPKVLWFGSRLRVWFSAQKQPAPLAIVISGTGSDGNTAKLSLLRGAL